MIIDGDVHISPHPGTDRIDADEALRRMDRAGVDRAICWLQPHYYIPEVEQSNAYIHQAMVQHPDRFLGFGWANPHLGLDSARDTVKRCLDEYGMYGIKLNGAQNYYNVDDPKLALPLIEEIAGAGKGSTAWLPATEGVLVDGTAGPDIGLLDHVRLADVGHCNAPRTHSGPWLVSDSRHAQCVLHHARRGGLTKNQAPPCERRW